MPLNRHLYAHYKRHKRSSVNKINPNGRSLEESAAERSLGNCLAIASKPCVWLRLDPNSSNFKVLKFKLQAEHLKMLTKQPAADQYGDQSGGL